MRTEAEKRRLMIEARARAHNIQPDTPWWYLSFASDEDGFLGACVVQGQDMLAAISRSHLLKINPGGQVMGVEHGELAAPPEKRNKLLSIEELEALGRGKKLKDMTDEELASIGLGSGGSSE